MIDVRMPEIDGLETARRLRKRSPETRVILVTGLDEPQLAEQAREAGAVALLTKGALHDELKEAILAAATALTARKLRFCSVHGQGPRLPSLPLSIFFPAGESASQPPPKSCKPSPLV